MSQLGNLVSFYRECPSCVGLGRMYPDDPRVCPNCEGKGWFRKPPPPEAFVRARIDEWIERCDMRNNLELN